MANLFNTVLYQPLLNLLFVIYNNAYADLGVAIIILTLVIRFVLLPIFYKSAKDQTVMQKIAPKIREIQQTHKNDKERQVKEIMAIYKEHKVNPFSGILLMIIQLPILIALYSVFLRGFSEATLKLLYSFVSIPAHINYSFLGLFDLNQKNIAIVIVAAVGQYLQSYLLLNVNKKNQNAAQPTKEASVAQNVSKQMMYVGPILTFIILYSLPSAVGLYWLTTSVFSVVQQLVINKKINKKNEGDSGDNPKIN